MARKSNAIRLEIGQAIETRAVLAGAYRGNGRAGGPRDNQVCRTHLVLTQDETIPDEATGGRILRDDVHTFCRVPVENIVDAGAHTADELTSEPTCKTCARVWQRLHYGKNALSP